MNIEVPAINAANTHILVLGSGVILYCQSSSAASLFPRIKLLHNPVRYLSTFNVGYR